MRQRFKNTARYCIQNFIVYILLYSIALKAVYIAIELKIRVTIIIQCINTKPLLCGYRL